MRKKNDNVSFKNTARRHNRSHNHGSINQNVAQHPPKWADRGDGVLVRKSNRHHGDENTMIKLTTNGWENYSNRSSSVSSISNAAE